MKKISLLSLLVLVSACQSSPATPGSTYAEVHAAAVAAINESAVRGHEWSTAGKLLEEGVAAAADGDEAMAIRLTEKARIQAELSVRQADIEESAWNERVLSD